MRHGNTDYGMNSLISARAALRVFSRSLILLAALQCTPSEGSRNLTGHWTGEFRTDRGSEPSARNVVGLIVLRVIRGSVDECKVDSVACATLVKGSHNVDFTPMLGHRVEPEAQAAVLDDGTILLVLGRCCDRGEVSARGRFTRGEIRGVWSETRIGEAREGTFSLRRQANE